MQLILHHYDFSNYAEKARLALGYKSLEWHSVTIPSVAPKPDLQILTGGYRRTPVLQIGADIYCDTNMILRVLEAVQPKPTLFPEGISAQAKAIAYWAETQLFRPIALYVSGSNPDVFPMSLQADRARMRGVEPPGEEAMARAAARSGPLVRVQLPLVEDMLSDGRQWILGSVPSIADFSIYHALWFITGRTDRLAFELEPFERIRNWMARMAAFGHGTQCAMEATQALQVATDATPVPPGASRRFAEDPPVGSRVRIRAADYGRETVEGELVLVDHHELAVKRIDDALGEIVVHFPRLGYDLIELR
jgi:glutathione S-transferase